MADLAKIADVLEKTAALLDLHESEKSAAEKEARESRLAGLGQKYTAATGEELPRELAEKLAAGNETALEAVESIVEKTASTVESLGRSSERPDSDSSRGMTKTERAQAAWDRMGRFINS